jgi:hypothetical protein
MSKRQELTKPAPESLTPALRENTALALDTVRKILRLKPKKSDKDYAKLIATQGSVALGVMNLRMRVDIEALRGERGGDTLAQLLDRIRHYDQGEAGRAHGGPAFDAEAEVITP